jgi:hypothetical protein
MNNTEEIIRYIVQDMEEKELDQFKLMLETDPLFRKKYEDVLEIWKLLQKELRIESIEEYPDRETYIAEIIAAIDVADYGGRPSSIKEEEFRNTLKSIVDHGSETDENNKSKKNLSTRNYSLIFLAAAAILMFFIFPNRNLTDLTVSYYSPSKINYTSLEIEASRSDNILAIQLFREGRYEAARKAFEPWNDTIEVDPLEKFIYAITCYETGDLNICIEILKSLIDSNKSEIAYEAKWYTALIYLKEGKPEKAKVYLKQIESTKGAYQAKSKKLIRRIS